LSEDAQIAEPGFYRKIPFVYDNAKRRAEVKRMMQPKSKWYVILSVLWAALGVSLLLTQLDARWVSASARVEAQGAANPWPLTSDGRSRFAGWSPDGRAALINRWGTVVGGGATRQTLSELWAVSVRGDSTTRLSENAIQPVYADDGRQLAYLAYSQDGQWEARVLDVNSGQDTMWGDADWRVSPAWVGEGLAFVRGRQVRLSREGVATQCAGLPVLPEGARASLSGVGGIAWRDGAHLWALSHSGAEPRLLVADERVMNFAWSPDGRRLAYVLVADDLSPALWMADVAGGESPVLLAQGRAETFSSPSWSPDGRTLAFSRTPLGAETASASDIWLVDASGDALQPLLQNDLEESDPVWSPDGRYIAFDRAGDVWGLDLTQPLSFTNLPISQSSSPPVLQSPTIQQTPPLTIRVIHREDNYYRDVPVGQIDVITFENYVKRCVPVEVYASWPMETLKVQAMAVRTYAWRYTIEHADWDWDVSDWTDYQVMGRDDQRHPRSDAATNATQGQYIAYQGDVIKAFYSAENSSPTRSAAGYPYIQAVDDPVGFGRERRGHGWGMSQWGAYRWAAWHGWGYQQILAHYYTSVTVELPSTDGPLPLGGVTMPWSDYYVTGNRVYVVANASDEASDVSAVGFYAVTDTVALLVTDTVGSDGWSTVWDVSALSDTTTSQAITLSLRVADGAGHVQTQTQMARIGLDRQPPTATAAVIHDTYTSAMTITISSLSATDPSPGSGVQAMAFSNEGWAWEGEDLYHVPGSGEVFTDSDALNGRAWRGVSGVHSAGAWYGPYTYVLPPGYAYRAYFRLKTNDATTTTSIATLDVVDDGGERILGLRRLRGTDFRAAGTYQEFPVDLHYPDAGDMGLEFRTAFYATADLYLDRVLVVGYPTGITTTAQWPLTPGEGLKTVTVKFIDGAGNVSADLTRTVTLDASPPTGWQDFAPEQWDGGPLPTCTVRVRDEVSGLDVDSARYRFSTDGGASWSDWLTAMCTGISGTTEVQTVTTPAVPFGLPRTPSNRIQFQVADMAGFTSTAAYVVRGPLSIVGPSVGTLDTPYTFTAGIDLLTGTVVPPVTYTWQATGQTSVTHRNELSDTAVFTWGVVGSKAIIVTATSAGGVIGSAAHGIAIAVGRYIYLPLVMRDWFQGSVALPVARH
jgi:WD40 repeat protein